MNDTVRYVIEGNLATREVISKGNPVPLESLMAEMTAYQPLQLSPVPSNLKYIQVAPRANMQLKARILVGHDPVTRRISHKNCPASSRSAAPQSYALHLPYGLFWFLLFGNKLVTTRGEEFVWTPQVWGYVWMAEPFHSLEQMSYQPLMPNIYGDTRICFGSTRAPGNPALGPFIDGAVNTFWTSEFNQDLSNAYPYASMQAWERADPDEWRTWPHLTGNAGMTIASRMQRFDGDQFNFRAPVPSTAGEAIPELPTYPTFDNLDRWANEISETNRARIQQILNQAPDGA